MVNPDKLINSNAIDNEETFLALGDLLPYPIWLATPNGSLFYFNQAVYNYSGMKDSDFMHGNWINIVHPDDRAKNMSKWLHSVTTNEQFIFEHRFRRHDGEYRWHLSRGVPKMNRNGEVILWVGTTLDIHEQKMHSQILEDKVRERTHELIMRNKELEQFAYVASHDMQEPLRKIQTFISILLKSDVDNLSDTQKQLLYKIDAATFRLRNIIKDILNYSHQTGLGEQITRVDINSVIKLVHKDLELLIKEKNGRIIIHNMPVVFGIQGQVNQLFYNIIHNALKFSKKDIPPLIRISTSFITQEYLQDPSEKELSLSITDNGIGFEEKYTDKIFGLFQRLHDRHTFDGTGIGLALCKKIAENHNWKIRAVSTYGMGTTIELKIPLKDVVEYA
jgi:PAS domain S-box-containing protein